MGARAQVKIEDGNSAPIYLYSHWAGKSIVEDVKEALARRERWDDSEYLARIVFQHMIGDDKSSTGYGIGTEQHGDIEILVELLNNQRVRIGEQEWSFNEFIDAIVDLNDD